MEKKESTEKTSCSKQKMENLNKGKTQRQVKLEETDHKNEEKKKTGEGEEMTKRSLEKTMGEGWRRRHVKQPKLEAGCGWLCSNRKRREENRRRKKGRGTGEIEREMELGTKEERKEEAWEKWIAVGSCVNLKKFTKFQFC